MPEVNNHRGTETQTGFFIPLWRGVRVDNSKVVYGYCAKLRDFIGTCTIGEETKYLIIEEQPNGNAIEVIPESLAMQNGLKDANGVDIYGSMPGTRGGDVAELWGDSDEGRCLYGTSEVIYRNGEVCITDKAEYAEPVSINQWIFGGNELKIIGNAYLNPELLEVMK